MLLSRCTLVLGDDDARVAEYGALVEREAERMGARVERVLRFAGGTSRGETFEDVDVGEVVETAVEGCEHWRDRRRFRVETELEPDLPPLHADRSAVVSALQNLIDNAVKYGPDGGVVRVRGDRVRCHR